MIWKRMFGRDRVEPRASHINLKGKGLTHEAEHEGVRVWRTEEGDGVGVFYFDMPPDLPRGQSTESDFLDTYSAVVRSQGISVVELEICNVVGYKALKSIVKVPQHSTGIMYIGALTLPFRDHSFVVKIQCEESGITGVREAILMDRALAEGSVQIAADGAFEGEGNPEDACNDSTFPDHPLTRARKWLPRIQSSISVDERLMSLQKFEWPG